MFVVETFTLKTEKMADFPCPKMFQDLIKKRPDLMKELKSWGVYQESFGTAGGFIEFSEFDSYEDSRGGRVGLCPIRISCHSTPFSWSPLYLALIRFGR